MKILLNIIIIALASLMVYSQNNDSIELNRQKEYQKQILLDTIDGVFIPRNIDDCISQINSFWNDSLKNEIKRMNETEFTSIAHWGFGRWMRNNWCLWSGSRLSLYFNNLGIYHPDDMSGIILKSYYRKLIKKDIDLEGQIKFYQNYWKNIELARKGQSKEILESKKWLIKNNLKFRTIQNLQGRTIFLDCDSIITLKKVNHDTIFYWTTGSLTPYTTKEMKGLIKSENFINNAYINQVFPDGRINVIFFKLNEFVFRNDTLYEKAGYYEISHDSIMSLYDLALTSKSDKKQNYYWNLVNKNTLYTFKMIFTPNLFINSDKVKSNQKYYENEEITLNGYWKVNGVKYYQITVENSKEQTEYSYIFDENCKFIKWEGCNKNIIDKLTENNKRKILND